MFSRDGDNFTIPIPPDEDGYTGRECPECESYFKIVFGTGLEGATECYCPYCGHTADHSNFYTKAQIEYAQSVALNKITGEFIRELKKIERHNRPNRRGFINLTFKVTGSPTPIQYYWEPRLETHVVCSNCTLKYAVYGVYAFCPDCGQRNAHQILDTSLDIALKLLQLAEEGDKDLSESLIGNALSSVIASFDGFGREMCRHNAAKSSNLSQAEGIRFQNLAGAQTNVQKYFGFDIAGSLTTSEWEMAIRCFQKRHILLHNSGVIDQDYFNKANDPSAILGRKITLTADEVRQLVAVVRKLGEHLMVEMEKLP